jgi:tetratricopeptide (TPR) repeat protein
MHAARFTQSIRSPRSRWLIALSIVLLACALAQPAPAQQPPTADTPARLLQERVRFHREQLNAHPHAFEHRFGLAKNLHLQGAAGDEEAAKEAYERFEQLHAEHPDRPIVTAYYGGATLMAARRQFFPWDKLAKLKDARTLLNRAIDQAQDPYLPRLLRGIAVSNLPKSLDKRKQARDDLRWSIERMDTKRRNGEITPAQAAAGRYHWGRMLAEAGQTDAARDQWRRAREIAPQSYAGLQADQRLRGVNEN